MSYYLDILVDKPLGLWMLDDAAPFQDYSGYNRAGVMDTGSPTTAASLVANAAYSSVFSNSVDAKFDSPVYQQGYENQAFALEASFRVIDESGTTSPQKILSSTSNYDGITVDGTVISFSTKYASAGDCTVSYDIQVKRNVHVVGVHTLDKNQLYVDGTLVAEKDLTPAQKEDSYVTTDGKLWLGTSASSQKVAVNALAIYAGGLNDTQVKNHFNAARTTVVAPTIPTVFGGTRFPLSQNLADVYLRSFWTTESDWKIGVQDQISIINGRMVPQLIEGVSIAGEWQTVVRLDSGTTSIYGVSIDWDGYGVVVEASLDGTTWETVERGKRLTVIPDGFDPTDEDLQIKLSFPGGITDDPSYVDNLRVTGFLSGDNPDVDGRTITLVEPASPMSDAQPIEQRDDFGVRLDGGSVVIGPDTADTPVDAFTVNIWLKKLGATSPTINVTPTATYKNGQVAGTMNEGEWVMWTLVKSTAITGDITITGDVQVGQVEIFDSALTADQVAELYAYSVGIPAMVAAESNTVNISNPNPSTRLYDYDWAITSTG